MTKRALLMSLLTKTTNCHCRKEKEKENAMAAIITTILSKTAITTTVASSNPLILMLSNYPYPSIPPYFYLYTPLNYFYVPSYPLFYPPLNMPLNTLSNMLPNMLPNTLPNVLPNLGSAIFSIQYTQKT
jgi:hypothetical protein